MKNVRAASLTRQQVRAIDRWAIEQLGVSGLVLMENAGRGVVDAIAARLGRLAGRPASAEAAATFDAARIAIVAGAGNNGGDGFVVARHLFIRGARVEVFLVAPEDKMTGDAGANLTIIRRLGVEVRPLAGEELNSLAARLQQADLVVDAVGGTGIQGPLRGDVAAAVRQINAAGRPVAAVDIPTGLDCDTGEAHDPTVRAALTVTFVGRKVGFDAPGAAGCIGEVVVADIGVPARHG